MQKWLGVAGFAGLAVCGAFVACSSSAANPYPDVGSFCQAKAQAECQIASTCVIDQNACIQVRAGLCNQEADQATASGTRQYNSANAQACINAVKSVYGSGRVSFNDLTAPGGMQDTCNKVFQGSVDKDKECASNYDCIGNRICAPVAPGSTMSVCADSQNANPGDFCANPGTVCQGNSYCAVPMGGAPQCTAEPTEGQACGAAIPCASSLRCAAGTCTPQVAPAGACTTNSDCGPMAGYCDPNVGSRCGAGACCTSGLIFAPGSLDCNPYMPGGVNPDGGSPPDSGSPPDTGAADTGSTTDSGTDTGVAEAGGD